MKLQNDSDHSELGSNGGINPNFTLTAISFDKIVGKISKSRKEKQEFFF